MVTAAPRRLTLTAGEWAVLAAGRLGTTPPAFAPASLTARNRDGAIAALVRARVVVAPGGARVEPVPAVAAQLAVLRRPVVTLRLDITGRAGTRQGWFAVGAGMVAGVLTLPGGRIELSLAPEVRLGTELVRVVPPAAALPGRFPVDARPGDGGPLGGRLPLALLEEPSAGATPDERALAGALERRTGGVLSCLVLGRAGTELRADRFSWLATGTGWVGVRPRPDGSPRRLVDLVPVEPAELATWVAPSVAALLAGTDGAA